MLDYLKSIPDNFDALFFMPVQEDDGEIYVQANNYKNHGELIGSSEIGPKWHIVLFKYEDKKIKDLDCFEGIFSDPREYISGLIPSGWYGVVAKKTTTSEKFLDETLDKFKVLF